jgi:hypothetical protein
LFLFFPLPATPLDGEPDTEKNWWRLDWPVSVLAFFDFGVEGDNGGIRFDIVQMKKIKRLRICRPADSPPEAVWIQAEPLVYTTLVVLASIEVYYSLCWVLSGLSDGIDCWQLEA